MNDLAKRSPLALAKPASLTTKILMEIAEMKASGEIDAEEAAVLGANALALHSGPDRMAMLREAQARLAAKYPDGRVSIDLGDMPPPAINVVGTICAQEPPRIPKALPEPAAEVTSSPEREAASSRRSGSS